MAERRMFAKNVIDSDLFLDMPLSTQALYFHLAMRADDDGFVNNPKKIVRMIGADNDSLRILIEKSFLIPFETGIVVIRHWKVHNYIRRDTYKETSYKGEKSLLCVDESDLYNARDDAVTVPSQLRDDAVDGSLTQVRLGKDRIGKDRIEDSKGGENSPPAPTPSKRFTKPTLEEVRAYCQERKNGVNPEKFVDYYDSNGWKVGKNPMKDWKAAVRTWEKNRFDKQGDTAQKNPDIEKYKCVINKF